MLNTLIHSENLPELCTQLDKMMACDRVFERAMRKIRTSIFNLDALSTVNDICVKWARDDHVFNLIYLWSVFWDSDTALQRILIQRELLLPRIPAGHLRSPMLLPELAQKLNDYLAERLAEREEKKKERLAQQEAQQEAQRKRAKKLAAPDPP